MMANFKGLEAALASLDEEQSQVLSGGKSKAGNVRSSPLDRRNSAINSVGRGNRKTVSQLYVDPGQCRMWAGHNRIYDLLTPENCADLISSIKAEGRQKTAAIARRLRSDKEGYEYEIIAGARRHFAVDHLRQNGMSDLDYFIEVRMMSDEEAFLAADAENRGRQDISDFERAKDYARGLLVYFNGNQSEMARRLGIARGKLKHYITLAGLPDEIVQAYLAPTHISLRASSLISSLLSDHRKKKLVVAEARKIAGEQEILKEKSGGGEIDGPSVTKRLVSAGNEVIKKKRAYRPVIIRSEGGQELFTMTAGHKFITLKVSKSSLKTPDELIDKLRQTLLE